MQPGARIDLGTIDAADTSDGPATRQEAEQAVAAVQAQMFALQDKLRAESTRALLVILQGTDASGKDGTVRHVFTGLNPQATRVAAFKEPTPLELRHDFLWRVHQVVPGAGEIGIFNRSHYEDVVAVRVRGLITEATQKARFPAINAFERLLSDGGTTILKFFLHVSKAEQRRRFDERAASPDKAWKLRPEDEADRKLWGEFQASYSHALTETGTEWAPWYVIPADHKWFRNWAVSTIVVDALSRLDPHYPRG